MGGNLLQPAPGVVAGQMWIRSGSIMVMLPPMSPEELDQVADMLGRVMADLSGKVRSARWSVPAGPSMPLPDLRRMR